MPLRIGNGQAVVSLSTAEDTRQDGVRGGVCYAPSSRRSRQDLAFLGAGMLCPVEWWSINPTSFEVRLHGRHHHGRHLITLHNKTRHQGPVFNWDKGNERGHLKWCLILLWGWPSAQASLGGHCAPGPAANRLPSDSWLKCIQGSQACHLGTIHYSGTLYTAGQRGTREGRNRV